MECLVSFLLLFFLIALVQWIDRGNSPNRAKLACSTRRQPPPSGSDPWRFLAALFMLDMLNDGFFGSPDSHEQDRFVPYDRDDEPDDDPLEDEEAGDSYDEYWGDDDDGGQSF